MTPADENECRQMLQTGYQHQGPALVRYPRGTGPGVTISSALEVLPLGKGEIRRQGRKVALLAFGGLLSVAEEVAERLDATVANMRFVKPLDEELVLALADSHELLVTLEENVIQGGAGSAVNEYLASIQHAVRAINLGLPDRFIEHATQQQQLNEVGLDAAGLLRTVSQALDSNEGQAIGSV